MTSSCPIWESNYFRSTTYYAAPLLYNYDTGDQDRVTRVMLSSEDLIEGKPVDQNDLPDSFIVSNRYNNEYSRLENDFLWGKSLPIITKKAKDILDKFNIGETKFFQVKIYREEGADCIQKDFYILNIVSMKNGFSPEKTHFDRAEPSRLPGVFFSQDSPSSPIFVHKSACEGADIWMDPRLWKAIFF